MLHDEDERSLDDRSALRQLCVKSTGYHTTCTQAEPDQDTFVTVLLQVQSQVCADDMINLPMVARLSIWTRWSPSETTADDMLDLPMVVRRSI